MEHPTFVLDLSEVAMLRRQKKDVKRKASEEAARARI